MPSNIISLEVFRGGRSVAQHSTSDGVIKIGRLPSSNVLLADPVVARMHAVVESTGTDVRVVDLGSQGGTQLNGASVSRSEALCDGDELEIGPYRIAVRIEATAAARAAAGPAIDQAGGLPMPAQAERPSGASPPSIAAAAHEADASDQPPVMEVIAMLGNTVLDVRHVGGRRRSAWPARAAVAVGGIAMMAGLALFATEASADWETYRTAQQEARDAGASGPVAPGHGLGGLGFALGLLGLIPLSAGVVRLREQTRQDYIIGESASVDLATPCAGLPGSAMSIIDEGRTLGFTSAMTGEVTAGGHTVTLAELVQTGRAQSCGDHYALPLPNDAKARVRHGDLTFHVKRVPPGRVAAGRQDTDKPFWLYNAASLATVGSLILLSQLVPEDAFGMSMDPEDVDPRFVGYIQQPDVEPDPPPSEQASDSTEDAGGQGQRAAGNEGKMGRPSSKKPSGIYAAKKRGPVMQLSRSFDPEMSARKAGILGLMQTEQGHFLAMVDGAAYTSGVDDDDVWGGLTGTEVGESHGVGGMGLVGTGRGGGGDGQGVGLGGIGLIGKGGGGGNNIGYGRGDGFGPRFGTAHGKKKSPIPKIRIAKGQSRGMDRDVIRRVIRAHINEVRHCYNQGLVRNPNLRGRVAVQFTIERTGRVQVSVPVNSSTKDPTVDRCIAGSVKRWRFPRPPAGGSAVVTYPFVLNPG